jgi:DNA-binding FadR family transcriptional regulator
MLEKGAAEVAALKRDDNDIAVMENTLNDQKKLSGRAFVLKHSNEADIAFHLAVLKSAHSELMYKMSSVILAYFNTVYTTDESVNTDVDAVEHEHEEILKAIKARDPQKAGAFMGRHLLKKNEITA